MSQPGSHPASHPPALPSGAGVEISTSGGPGHELGYVIMHLVRTSQQCTGS